MKKTISAITLIAVMAMLLSVNVFAAGTCELIGIDKTTRGDWIGTYGGDGYFIVSNPDSDQLPAYASFEALNGDENAANHHVWFQLSAAGDLTDEQTARLDGALFTAEGKEDRVAGCYYDGSIMNIDLDIGSETKYVTLYSLDYDEQSRYMDINVYDESGKLLLNTELDEFSMGAYLKLKVSGKIRIEYVNLTSGQNSVVAALFFDSLEGTPVPETTEQATEAPETTAAPQVTEAPETTQAVQPVTSAPETGDNGISLFIGLAVFGAIALLAIAAKKKHVS